MAQLPVDLGLPRALRHSRLQMQCQGCSIGHFQKSPHKRIATLPPPGHTLVTDIAGPFPKTAAAHQYFLTITELNTRMRFAYLIRTRGETPKYLTGAITKIERHFAHPIARLTCDNANEFLTKTMLDTFRQRAIALGPTIPHTPEENAIAKRLNRTLVSQIRATLNVVRMLFDKYGPS